MKNKIVKEIQHGDISLHKIEILPNNLEEVKHNGAFVVAEGEATGHQHRVKGDFQIYKDKNGNYYIQSKQAEIEHYDSNTGDQAEHKTLPMEGVYFVRREERYNPFLKALERVSD